jgi:hypothetical protein
MHASTEALIDGAEAAAEAARDMLGYGGGVWRCWCPASAASW